MEKIITNSFDETQKLGEELAKKILAKKIAGAATVLALRGDLGAGKTTFLQGFAKGLGIDEVVNSPTFVIMKKFPIPFSPSLRGRSRGNLGFKYFYHFDLYRLNLSEEILSLGFQEIITDPKNIVAIEWPEKIGNLLPKNAVEIMFAHLEENKRTVLINL